MQGGHRSAPRWVILCVCGLAGALLLACVIPGLFGSAPASPLPTSQPQPLASPTPTRTALATPGASEMVARISEQDMNQWLQEARAQLDKGADFQDGRVTIRRTGITLSGNMVMAQMPGVQVPVEIALKPVVSGEELHLEVLDVQLGGAYSSLSSLITPLVKSKLTEGIDVNKYLTERGMHISRAELEDGFIVITGQPAP